jgi:hypothetical protein
MYRSGLGSGNTQIRFAKRLSFHNPQGPDSGDLMGKAGALNDVYYQTDIFISLWALLPESLAANPPGVNIPCFEFPVYGAPAGFLDGLAP